MIESDTPFSRVRRLVWDRTSPLSERIKSGPLSERIKSGPLSERIKSALTNPDAQRAVLARSAESSPALVIAARAGDSEAVLVLYMRHLVLLEKMAARFDKKNPIVQRDDFHQDGVVVFLEMIANPTIDAENVPSYLEGYLKRRLSDVVWRFGPVAAVPRHTVERMRVALRATATEDGAFRPAAAAVWVSTHPESEITIETFWAAWAATYGSAGGIDQVEEPTDFAAVDSFEDVDNRDAVARLDWNILDEVDTEILRRTYLFDGDTRDTDDKIAIDLGVSRSTVSRRRQDALEYLRYEKATEKAAPTDRRKHGKNVYVPQTTTVPKSSTKTVRRDPAPITARHTTPRQYDSVKDRWFDDAA